MTAIAKPAVPPNVRSINVSGGVTREKVEVVPIRFFAALITPEKGKAAMYLGAELHGVYYSFPSGVQLAQNGNFADGFVPFNDSIQKALRAHFTGASAPKEEKTPGALAAPAATPVDKVDIT